MDSDTRRGPAYRGGRMSIGVIVHSNSYKAGHGPGMTTLLTGPADCLRPVCDDAANIAFIMERRAFVAARDLPRDLQKESVLF